MTTDFPPKKVGFLEVKFWKFRLREILLENWPDDSKNPGKFHEDTVDGNQKSGELTS